MSLKQCLLLLLLSLLSCSAAFYPTSRSQQRPGVLLYDSLRSNRAHIEKRLEDMMNNDWRAFRAKLVAQEQAEAALVRTIEAADPFTSRKRFARQCTINKQKWAHEIPHVEPGCVLIANDRLGGVFHQTVMLVLEHCEEMGSIGVILNRPLQGGLAKVAAADEGLNNLSSPVEWAFASSPVTYGGPFADDEYRVVHGFGQVEGSTKICPGVFVGGLQELLDEVQLDRFDPRKALFVKGHTTWAPGQLSEEIAGGFWYTAAVSSDMILRHAEPVQNNAKDLRSDILVCMGGKYASMAAQGPRGIPLRADSFEIKMSDFDK